jgi:hypothetical protein
VFPEAAARAATPLHVEMDAVNPVSVPYAFSNDTSLKTAFRRYM